MKSSFRKHRNGMIRLQIASDAKKSVKKIINGNNKFEDVVIIAQNQLADEFPDVSYDADLMAEAILLMTTLN